MPGDIFRCDRRFRDGSSLSPAQNGFWSSLETFKIPNLEIAIRLVPPSSATKSTLKSTWRAHVRVSGRAAQSCLV